MDHMVVQARELAGLSQSALAKRSGVSRSTQFRIESGAVDPGLGTVRELALACGFELRLDLAPLSDPHAANAARAMLDHSFDLEVTPAIREWIERLERWVPDKDPIAIVREAGTSSSLHRRDGAVHLAGSVDELKLASAGEFSRAQWAVSGTGVLQRMAEANDGPVTGVHVVYTADKHRYLRLLDNMTPVRHERAALIVADYTEGLDQDAWLDGRIRMVAPIQALIDGFGLGGELASAAERIARSWSE